MAAPPITFDERKTSTESSPSPVISFDGVSIAFEGRTVLDKISFQLNKGETKAIFGVAGSGKSTILKLALGLMKPDAGDIRVLGEDVTQMREEDLFDLGARSAWCFRKALCSIRSRCGKMLPSGCSSKMTSPKNRWKNRCGSH